MDTSLQFLGAAQNVTGSSYLLRYEEFTFLIDCGMFRERAFLERNWATFPVAPQSINAVLLTHAHADHCALLPKLVREGFSGPIICTSATMDIAKIVLADSARIQEEDAEYKSFRHRKAGKQSRHEVKPLYTVDDAEMTFPLFESVGYKETVGLPGGCEATFFDAGHILGSSMIMFTIPGPPKRSILFSGDIGRPDKPILEDPTQFQDADYVLIESTYGTRVHEDEDDIDSLLASAVGDAAASGGNVVIPSFAIGRTQELLYRLNALIEDRRIPPIPIYVDSPMAVRVSEVFKKHPEMYDREMTQMVSHGDSPFSMSGLHMVKSRDESKALNHRKGSSIIIAGSGMCTGGRIKHHLSFNIGRPESIILFVGYQAVGTLGREILEGKNEVRIYGRYRQVKAQVKTINGFSAHADRTELLNWLSHLSKPSRMIFVVHGEPESALSMQEAIRSRGHGKTCVPEYLQTVTLK